MSCFICEDKTLFSRVLYLGSPALPLFLIRKHMSSLDASPLWTCRAAPSVKINVSLRVVVKSPHKVGNCLATAEILDVRA